MSYDLDWLAVAQIEYAQDTIISNLLKQNDRKPEGLYHYTDTNVLDCLLSKAEFRATNIFYLNDKNEYKLGIKRLLKCIEEMSEMASQDKEKCIRILNNMLFEDGKSIGGLYTISFSKRSDSLHQWITYAKQSGVAIELDKDLVLPLIKNELPPLNFQTQLINDEYAPCTLSIVDMIYKDEDVKKLFPIIVESINNISNSQWGVEEKEACYNILIRLYSSYIKDSAFGEESETRITVMPVIFANQYEQMYKINYFRMQSGVLRPYINIKICNDKNDEACLPLKSITVGPSGVQQTIYDSVVHRVKYGKCNIYNYFVNNRNAFLINFYNYLLEANSMLSPIKEIHLEWNDGKSIEQLFEIVENFDKTEIEKINLAKALIYDWIKCNEKYLSMLGVSVGDLKKFDSEYSKNDIQDKIRETKQNLYFTKDGILIRKSKIPYIF